MADYKPNDLFVGVVDLLGILLPGALLVYLALPMARGALTLLPPLDSDLERWAAFLVAAYVAGHFLHQAGDLVLDRHVYDKRYVEKKRRAGAEPILVKVRQLMAEHPYAGSAFSWAGSFVRLHSARATDEVERAGAESKFFRSLALVAFISLLVAVYRDFWDYAAFAALVTAFALWRYCDRRWKAAQLTYEYFVMLKTDHDRANEPSCPGSSSPENGSIATHDPTPTG